MNASIWSAIAASFSALSAFLVMLIQRRNLLESVRPELVLLEMERKIYHKERDEETITILSMKNVGRGAALHVWLNSGLYTTPDAKLTKVANVGDRPVAFAATKRLPIIGPGAEVDLNYRVHIFWKNCPDNQGKYIPLTIHIGATDCQGMRHTTTYSYLVVELKEGVGIADDDTAPGVGFTSRLTVTESILWRKLKAALGKRVPAFRKILGD